ncbi:MAG TPA: Ltp family lipoprotein [Solirubrobacteraceae bacterium]|nr:Ltp family lipoprotein [Solirubrobacteraceae bacterium]
MHPVERSLVKLVCGELGTHYRRLRCQVARGEFPTLGRQLYVVAIPLKQADVTHRLDLSDICMLRRDRFAVLIESSSDARYGATHCGANWNKEAVESAREYLKTQAFSLKGLVSQLKYGGFTSSQAEYGVARSGANWDQQAAKSAREYLKTQAFSASALIGQLEYSGFTASQAEYGAKAVGL